MSLTDRLLDIDNEYKVAQIKQKMQTEVTKGDIMFCPACKTDLRENGVTEVSTDVTMMTTYQLNGGLWTSVDEDADSQNGDHWMECRSCGAHLSSDQEWEILNNI